jgi:hypothetical protein
VLLLRAVLLALVVVFAAACAGNGPSPRVTATPASVAGSTETPGAPAQPTTGGGTAQPEATEDPDPTGEPVGTDEPEPTDEPSASEEPVTTDAPAESDAALGAPGAADRCTGSDDNRAFFEGIARAADWTVLCGVLPGGWFVSQGSYRLANGGKLLIDYKGPGGATVALSQGAFCSSADGCIPDGSEVGAAALGPLDATLYQTADGFAIVAAAGENPSWLMTTTGLDRASAVGYAAALAEVGR